MIEVHPYRYTDALAFDPKEIGVKNQPDYVKWAKMNELGVGYTIVDGNQIIACAGIRIFWEGVGEAWAIMSNNSSRYLKVVLEEFSKRLEFYIQEKKIRWIQSAISTESEKNIHFAQHFGFERKCEMKGYLPDGSDALLYAREIK